MKFMLDMLIFSKGNYVSVSLYELNVQAQQEAIYRLMKSIFNAITGLQSLFGSLI